ncbi:MULTISPECIES: DUF1127 domain-containing protein [unclassified Cognatiyoonia]|uniref:DUF1127 domain-containing protein n=1 Tax=unclassified Cognatiyoonia TaxID=2635977 RepID=UPI002A16D87D|nr:MULTISPECIES: DUF1127 domain-containing protein [unclassified Cognatiyoonia]MDX8348131.1 DUF1127 domain-containing protein [Cognatiyoonia sp. IB215446]MDX8351077.1 DUF1127 domain-containing protein [Cognatiyoonia sp. IB215182]
MTVTVTHTRATCATTTKTPRGLLARVVGMIAVRRQRNALKSLDDHLLRDIGLTRDEARIEAEKPLWDAPQYWSK